MESGTGKDTMTPAALTVIEDVELDKSSFGSNVPLLHPLLIYKQEFSKST